MKQSRFRTQNFHRIAIFVAAAGLLGWGCTIELTSNTRVREDGEDAQSDTKTPASPKDDRVEAGSVEDAKPEGGRIRGGWGQWFACQCGGPCEGAEPPPFNMPASCVPERGETVDGVYYPCRGNGIFCGQACSLCDPEDENCDTKDEHKPNQAERLCNKNLDCVIASEAYCF